MRSMTSIEHFRALLSLPSPSGNEEMVAQHIKAVMDRDGYLLREDRKGNLLFHRGTSGRKNILSAHMDVVPKAVHARVYETDDRFCTDGTTALGADDKCALAAMLSLADERQDCLFLFTVSEETGCEGSRELSMDLFKGLDPGCCFIPDAEGATGGIITAAPGKDLITITIHGKAAHAGFAPENGINAIAVLSQVLVRLRLGRIDSGTTSNVGSFLAPGTTNNVPDRAVAELEVRSVSKQKKREITESFALTAKKTAKEAGARAGITVRHAYQAYSLPENCRALREAEAAMREAGLIPERMTTTGGSDANNLRPLGIDAVTITAGYYHPHSEKEYITKEELRKLLCLLRLLSQPRPELLP